MSEEKIVIPKNAAAIIFSENNGVSFFTNDDDFPENEKAANQLLMARTVWEFINSPDSHEPLQAQFNKLVASLEAMDAADNVPDKALHAQEAAGIVKSAIDKATK
jgi:hypothetical protein